MHRNGPYFLGEQSNPWNLVKKSSELYKQKLVCNVTIIFIINNSQFLFQSLGSIFRYSFYLRFCVHLIVLYVNRKEELLQSLPKKRETNILQSLQRVINLVQTDEIVLLMVHQLHRHLDRFYFIDAVRLCIPKFVKNQAVT